MCMVWFFLFYSEAHLKFVSGEAFSKFACASVVRNSHCEYKSFGNDIFQFDSKPNEQKTLHEMHIAQVQKDAPRWKHFWPVHCVLEIIFHTLIVQTVHGTFSITLHAILVIPFINPYPSFEPIWAKWIFWFGIFTKFQNTQEKLYEKFRGILVWSAQKCVIQTTFLHQINAIRNFFHIFLSMVAG